LTEGAFRASIGPMRLPPQVFHRFDGHRVRRFLLLRPFGPATELDGDADPSAPLPDYDAAADLAPRTPQMLERDLEIRDLARPRVAPPIAIDCDRSGSCCAQYPLITATREEQDRGLVTLRQRGAWSLPYAEAEAFAPVFPGHAEPVSPIFSGDGCGFLGAQGCKIHAAGGALAKPATCRQFPLQVIHCGDHLELSQLPQCACAARCIRPSTPEDWSHEALTELQTIPEVPELVAVDERRMLPRSAYLQWVRALADVVLTPGEGNPSQHLHRAAESLGLSLAPLSVPWLERLEERALDEADRLEVHLAPTSPQPRGLRWTAELASQLVVSKLDRTEPKRVPHPSDRSVLALALRAHLLLELPTLASTLTDLARLLELTESSRGLGLSQELDPRCEPFTLLLYLWATTKWPVSSEPGPIDR